MAASVREVAERSVKVVLVNVWLDTERGGGTAERTRWLALHLAKLDCKCTIVTMGPTPWRSEFAAAGIDVLQVGYVGNRFPIPLPNMIKMLRLFSGADVIHVMGFWFLLASLCCSLARIADKPLILCPAGSLTKFGRSARMKQVYFRLLGRWMLRASNTVIATTEQEKKLFLRDFDIAQSKIFVSPNGIVPHIATSPTTPASETGRTIIFVGRLTAIKAPDLLIEAFASIATELTDVTLVIAGPDLGLRAQLEARTAALGLQNRVQFTGFVDERKRSLLLSRASLLVVPSHSEVMSMVALEAGALGVPVLLTDQCGFDEVARIGGGRVVPVDVVALSDAMLALMSDDTTLKVSGRKLQKFVLENYAWPNVAKGLLAHFSKLKSLPPLADAGA
jgi:glycosyltransferase involved in cell wall biosynthesis